MSLLRFLVKLWLNDVEQFSRLVARRRLYAYQLAPARAIVDSVLGRRGLEFAVMFPRQAGKNETQAQVEAYLLNVFQHVPGAQLVKAQPTFKPQAQNAVRRLEQALSNDWNKGLWKRGPEYQVRLGKAAALFYSASRQANVVGATASLLLQCDEAQDVLAAEWERKFLPMAVSANATVVYWGTAWTTRTLLARAIQHLRRLEARDGQRRVFVVSHDDVARENAYYAEAVRKHVARLGRQHPLVKTQYFNEEIDAEGGLFPPDRRARMQGDHPPHTAPRPAQTYAFLLDVGGEDQLGDQLALPGFEAEPDRAPRSAFDGRRDATALTIVAVDLETLADPLLAAPTYRAVHRQQWVGTRHARLYAELRDLARLWQPIYFVVDATGVGAGLASFLKNALGPDVLQAVTFNAEFKSRLGWGFLAVCDAGRWREWSGEVGGQMSKVGGEVLEVGGQTTDAGDQAPEMAEPIRLPTSDLQHLFWTQLTHCQYEIRPGPGRALAWGVPAGTRDAATGALVHDDLLLSAALCAELDRLPWRPATGPAVILRAADPLVELSQGF
jgi:nitroreductase